MADKLWTSNRDARNLAEGRLKVLLREVDALSPNLSQEALQEAASRITSIIKRKRKRADNLASGSVSEVAGLKLHLSSRSASGYHGVSDERSKGLSKPFHAIPGKLHGRNVNLGYFSTPVEAAIAIARYRLEHPEVKYNGRWTPSEASSSAKVESSIDAQAALVPCHTISLPPSKWCIRLNEALLVDVEDVGWVSARVIDVRNNGWFVARISPPGDEWEDWFNWQEEGSDWKRVSPTSEAAGLKLHLSSRSATGYHGVSDERYKGLSKPFHAVPGKLHGRRVSLGYFSTPVEAAAAIVRYRLQHPEVKYNERLAPSEASSSAEVESSIESVQVTQVESDDDDHEAVMVTTVAIV